MVRLRHANSKGEHKVSYSCLPLGGTIADELTITAKISADGFPEEIVSNPKRLTFYKLPTTAVRYLWSVI
jgi:hypothetical protein